MKTSSRLCESFIVASSTVAIIILLSKLCKWKFAEQLNSAIEEAVVLITKFCMEAFLSSLILTTLALNLSISEKAIVLLEIVE